MRIIGLLSGTSHDAVDAVATDLRWTAPGEAALRVVGQLTVPFPTALRAELTAALPPARVTLEEVCRLDTGLGRFFGEVAQQAHHGPAGGAAEWVASHGQTVYHWVRDGRAEGTLQLGGAAWIAQATGLPVVSDLRTADIAAGGQGAPLVALLDDLLLPPGRSGALNLGGIANLTVRGARSAGGDRTDALAYDLGPAGALVDEAAHRASGGAVRMDVDGVRAARGTVDQELLDRLLADPYYRAAPPKSTGKEHFHAGYLTELLGDSAPAPDDLVATVTELTARLVGDACHRHRLTRLVVSGGGVRNPWLMSRIRALAAPAEVTDSGVLGLPPQAKEGCLFALLGFLAVHGLPGNVPSATGARAPALLGSLTPGRTPLRLPEPAAHPLRRLRIEPADGSAGGAVAEGR